jgi:hypothetical protein
MAEYRAEAVMDMRTMSVMGNHMSDAQGYYDGLIAEGYTAEQATEYTAQHYPDFAAAPAVAAPDQFAAPPPAMAAPPPAMAAPTTVVVQAAPMAVAAGGSGEWALQTANYGLFFTKLIGFLLTGITFGLALPWAKCMVVSKWADNVRLDGRRIRFTGSGGALFGIWVKVFLLTVVTLSIYYWFWGYKAVAKYIDAHIEWA